MSGMAQESTRLGADRALTIQQRLAEEVSRYGEALEQLYMRLSPILDSQEPTPDRAGPVPAPRHPFDDLLNGFSSTNDRLQVLLRLIDL